LGTGIFLGLRSLAHHRNLTLQLAIRDLAMRYKNSVLGVLWIIGQPLLQLLLYGFVFQVVLRARWGINAGGSEVPFGLVLFVGILLHALVSETLVRAPSLIVSNTSYVKRVIFPLEILPLVNVASSVLSTIFGLVVLLVATWFFTGRIPLGVLFVPIPLILLALLTLGLGWLFAALGVFVRDLGQLTNSISTILLFTAPICYPAEMVPEKFRFLLSVNPLSIPVECIRSLLFTGHYAGWNGLCIYALCSAAVAIIGYIVFQRMRAGFADAL